MGATSRDQLAVLRDRKLAQRDASWADDGRPVAGVDLVLRAAENRRRLGVYRSEAIEARARAAVDREQASRDRELAARDRLQAQADRELLVSQLAITATDPLTGARTRVAGLVDLEHEIDRARRTAGRLVVAYVDVVGLKAINDAEGHAAGDALLRRVVEAIRGRMRSYDLIIRLGGDEFLCAMSGATGHEARERFDSVTDVLAAESVRSQIRVGFAALSAQDGADALIRRADAELLASRRAARTAVRHAT